MLDIKKLITKILAFIPAAWDNVSDNHGSVTIGGTLHMEWGYESIIPAGSSANYQGTKNVGFSQKFAHVPICIVSMRSTATTNVCRASIDNLRTTGVTLVLTRSNTNADQVCWFAIGQIS